MSEFQLTQWTYFYFGYSAAKQKAFAFARFLYGDVGVTFSNIKHYAPYWFGVYLGKDHVGSYPFNGLLSKWRMMLGEGAFQEIPLSQSCDDSCLLCSGRLDTECTYCPFRSYLKSGECKLSCHPKGWKDQLDYTCKSCETSCINCIAGTY